MNVSKKVISFVVIITLIISCSNTTKMPDNSPVDSLDLNRFLGTWYEIARYPHSFEKNLVGVTATYTLKNDGKIKVLNQGFKNTLDGKRKSAVGKAYIPDPEKSAHLRVSFFLFFYSDYLVMELDTENYNWAVIGSSSPNYLWILSRTPKLEEKILDDLRNRLIKRGYDLQELQMVPQKLD